MYSISSIPLSSDSITTKTKSNKIEQNIPVEFDNLDTETIFLKINKKQLDTLGKDIFAHQIFTEKKETFLVEGIKNLLKKNEFLQLSLDFSQGFITEEEYEQEMEETPEKYAINVKDIASITDLKVLEAVINKIGITFDTDQVTEIFGVSFLNIQQILK
jgi:hypothetical protein